MKPGICARTKISRPRSRRAPSGPLRQHFVDDGYFEGRRPFAMPIDERWYLTENPDVADSIRRGDIPSAQEHFDQDGYREGRLPFGM